MRPEGRRAVLRVVASGTRMGGWQDCASLNHFWNWEIGSVSRSVRARDCFSYWWVLGATVFRVKKKNGIWKRKLGV